MPGTLYLCATPIGNLEDLTLRALRVLGEVDLIAAEDTRETRKLLSHFKIATRLVSFHQHSRAQRTDWLVEQLQAGRSIAVVSSAGTPVVSDPGLELVRQCAEQGLPVVPIPGASAVLAALAASGLEGQHFLFAGFLPRKGAVRRRELERLRDRSETLVVFESPERLVTFLRDALEVLGDRRAVVARELTKRFEEFSRGSLRALVAQWEARERRGEFTIVIAGAEATPEKAGDLPAALECYDELIAGQEDRREALRRAAQKCGIPRNDLYAALLARGG